MDSRRVGVFGATSLVGKRLLPLLIEAGWHVTAFSRKDMLEVNYNPKVEWRQIKDKGLFEATNGKDEPIHYWISIAHIWLLPEYFDDLISLGARRLVALSSTSRFTKEFSSITKEQEVAQRLISAEEALQGWANSNNIGFVILRPTLIYGDACDRNICEIARIIKRFGFFPVIGSAQGLRQPIHAKDVAAACVSTLTAPLSTNRSYNLSGKEVLSYRDMISRIFIAKGRSLRIFTIPLGLFRMAVALISLIPRYRHWSVGMAERMNQDLVFDHTEATRHFNFSPQPFQLTSEDLPN